MYSLNSNSIGTTLQLSSIQSRSDKVQFPSSERSSNGLEGQVAKITCKLEISLYPMCDCFSGFSFEIAVTAAFSLLMKSINSNTCILYSHDSHELIFYCKEKVPCFSACVFMCAHACMWTCVLARSLLQVKFLRRVSIFSLVAVLELTDWDWLSRAPGTRHSQPLQHWDLRHKPLLCLTHIIILPT